MQMNNPLGIIQAIQNPQQFVENMMNNSQAMQNPMMKNAMGMFKNGDVKGLQQLTENVAKQRGTSIDEMRKKLKLGIAEEHEYEKEGKSLTKLQNHIKGRY